MAELELTAANQNRPVPAGKLAENIVHFARVLREAGLPAGPGLVLDALDAASGGGLRNRDDFYWTLHAVFVKKHEQTALFDQAFHVFWRKPKMLEQLMQLLFHQITRPADPNKRKQAAQRRLAQAFFDDHQPKSRRDEKPGELELDASFSWSGDEVLRKKDFEQMTLAEQSDAHTAIALMRLNRLEVPTRRFRSGSSGRNIDLRRTLRLSLRSGGGLINLAKRTRRYREPPLVVLCDISGSMSNYSRMFLHFLHSMMNDRDRVQVFLFGTQLTNITRELSRRDVDEAVENVSGAVIDWSGGTRIGHAINEFNYKWSRRVLTQGAYVMLMTDGLDRDDTGLLAKEMARLSRSAKRLIWLNPLLRFDGFEARAAGVRAIMPHVDEFRPVHNLESLKDLAAALAHTSRWEHDPKKWLAGAN